ncbi:MAG: hypothetical protein AABX04_04050 [Nanoarchaeota archaeon]
MSLFSKLAFWKKEDEFNFDQVAERDMNKPDPFSQGFEQNPEESAFPPEQSTFDQPQTPSPGASPQQYAQASRTALYPGSSKPSIGPSGDRDLDLINSKLDTIRAMLSAIEQRLDKIERGEPKAPPRLW